MRAPGGVAEHGAADRPAGSRGAVRGVKPGAIARGGLLASALALCLTIGAALAPPALGPALPFLAAVDAPVALASDDLGLTTKARYVVDPGARVVRVTVDIAVLNQKPNRVNGGVITRYFYNGVNLGVQTEAAHLRATQEGVAVGVSSSTEEGLPPRPNRASAATSTSSRPPGSGSSSTSPPDGRGARATCAWVRRSRRSSPGPSATGDPSGSRSRARSRSTSRAPGWRPRPPATRRCSRPRRPRRSTGSRGSTPGTTTA